jgi:hypothetical protein
VEEADMALYRMRSAGSRQILCSADCLTLLTDPEDKQGWMERTGSASDFCIHCFGCGGLLDQVASCLVHGVVCPPWSFVARATALEFAEHYLFLTESNAIVEAHWQLAAGLSETDLNLEGYELAEFVVPQHHDD